MCTSTATLLYGLWVTTASLAFAATAHHRTRAPFLAIDLILLRRRSGQLKLLREGASALVMMPPEVWELVKRQLVLVEAHDAELKEIAEFRCRQCSLDDVVGSAFEHVQLGGGEGRFTVEYSWDTWGPPPNDCDGCWENVFEGETPFLEKETRENTKALLQPYGLCVPIDRVWTSEPGAEIRVDFDSLLPISLPLRGSNSVAYPEVEAEQDHDYEYSSSHAVANISPAIFDLPADIHLRFASLVKTYGLEVIDRTTVEILPSNPPPPRTEAQDDKRMTTKAEGAASAQGKAKEKKAVKELKFGRVEPRWMLWSIGDPCS
ncbi:hypothetical protein BCR35DRAFT_310607 [Leucosporidium creatinivorum]|uniref:Uncharacterized protein n=1 Tax=Leucosporidium creatinivorum TaxID=106004 RepID=A0A1Y2D0R0_9BASI|nr:hypothetical protein BCR35DRAFT_310607 [Leucosporidium creatinivorum]